MDDSPPLLRPLPRRPFELTPTPSTESSSSAPTPRSDLDASNNNAATLTPTSSTISDAAKHTPTTTTSSSSDVDFSRTRSILNLTSSTLFGIYAPTALDAQHDSSAPPTPWGTGAETPARSGSIDGGQRPAYMSTNPSSPTTQQQQRPRRPSIIRRPSGQVRRGWGNFFVPLALRVCALFVLGVAYGLIVSHLHDNRHIAPVRVEGIDRASWAYLAFWGAAGVGLGSLLPWVDGWWEGRGEEGVAGADEKVREREDDALMGNGTGRAEGADWSPAVRSVGAFVGIAFAIRKLPWQSTLQVSLTLALANPVLWYLLDRSKPGFALSTFVGFLGTSVLLFVNPNVVPSPASPLSSSDRSASNASYHASNTVQGKSLGPDMSSGVVSYESIGVATWIASVLFCSCVCFGNIGRRLAVSEGVGRGGWKG